VGEAPAEIEAISFEPTGDSGLDVALSFVGALGIAGDHPAMVAAGDGNFDLISAHLAAMGDKARGYQQYIQLAKDAHGRITAAATAEAEKVTAAVHAIAGGATEWGLILAHAAANGSPEEKAQLNELFDSGMMGARAAAKLLTDTYRAAKGTVVNPASATRGQSGNVADTTNGPLSNREYHAAVQALHRQLGNRMDASPEYAALRARRTR
jgi:hypothetical protein